MKALVVFITLLTLFVTLPISIYQSWLLYKHVHATELMWFIWWLTWPLTILMQIISAVSNSLAKKS